MNIVDYFQSRKREIDEQLEAIESGRIIKLIYETKDGTVDVTEQEKQRLRKTSHDYWRAAENLKTHQLQPTMIDRSLTTTAPPPQPIVRDY